MELRQVSAFVDAIPYYRDRDLPACDPMRVRIMGHGTAGKVEVTTQLDASKPTRPDECFDVYPEELHFERSSFDGP